jgi:hypothetical protein
MNEETHTAAQAIDSPIAAQAERALETAKDKISTTVEQVRGFDLRQQVDAQPLATVGVAMLAGYMFGSMGGHAQADDRAHKDTTYDSADRHRTHDDQRDGMWSALVGQVSGELHTITAAAMSTAVHMLRDTIKEVVPQFSEEYERRSPSTERNATPLGDAPPIDGFNGGPTRIGNGGMRTTSDPNYIDRSQPIDPAI